MACPDRFVLFGHSFFVFRRSSFRKPQRKNEMVPVRKCWINPSVSQVIVIPAMVGIGVALLCLQPVSAATEARKSWDVTSAGFGVWTWRRNEEDSWRKATVPGSNEETLGEDGLAFDGALTYRLAVQLEQLPNFRRSADRKTWIEFQAVATVAKVYLIDAEAKRVLVGEHLGGWTPFRCDISKWVADTDLECLTFEVHVDELSGHNTQGFLPIIEPHFGGIWQSVFIVQTPTVYLDDLRLAVQGLWNDGTPKWVIEVPILGDADTGDFEVEFRVRRSAEVQWGEPTILELARPGESEVPQEVKREIAAQTVLPWTPADPVLYDFELTLRSRLAGKNIVDRVTGRTGFRSVETVGRQLKFNGQPVQIRGLLNWGYSTRHLGPTRSEQQMREELEWAKAWGFNLMKFCLWVPPRRYLELADEVGIMVWIEYPTWHPKLTDEYLDDLRQEYREFYCFDRMHPSIVLRSLTCETGHSADLAVVKELYDLAKTSIPGAIVEDDSSWIEWNRIHDFYDDHPYGNNHTWLQTLRRLQDFISQREPKPLLLGEAIAGDTWFQPSDRDLARSQEAFWLPGFTQANRAWINRMTSVLGEEAMTRLEVESKRYAWLMRKYQIETFRRESPSDGYVVSVIRDFPLAGMGLVDYRGNPKWEAKQWAWHGDRMVTLGTEHDRRSAFGGTTLPLEFGLHNHGPHATPAGRLEVQWRVGDSTGTLWANTQGVSIGEPGQSVQVELATAAVRQPMPLQLRVNWKAGDEILATNQWELWLLPEDDDVISVSRHESWNIDLTEQGWQGPEELEQELILTTRLDPRLLESMADGAKVLLVCDHVKDSFQQRSHWFLRGAPAISESVPIAVPRDFWVDLQHFDLASDVIPDWSQWETVKPWVLLWDNHDIREVKTHGLVMELPVGRGRLLVSSLNHRDGNAAGHWLLREMARYLKRTPKQSSEFGRSNLNRLRAELGRRDLPLDQMTWKFQVDASKVGFEEKWYEPGADVGSWSEIKTDRHWDGQGYESLDGWAWYRIEVDLPDDWASDTTYLSFTGVDDHYQAYVNGHWVGEGGDIETQQTAFEERASHEISRWVKPGEKVTIVVAVYDWYGAGGIFRPVSLTTVPLSAEKPWLQ